MQSTQRHAGAAGPSFGGQEILNGAREALGRNRGELAGEPLLRRAGQPLQYLLGECEFMGLKFKVNSSVLVPRPETELLVELALERRPSSVLDLGTGSGAIALAIKKHLPSTKVTAVEASAAALVVAKRNATKHGLEVDFRIKPRSRRVA